MVQPETGHISLHRRTPMRLRASSLAIASVIVAVAMVAGATLAPGRQFGGVYAPIVLPAAAVVYVVMGGAHNFGDGPGVYASTSFSPSSSGTS